MSALSDRWKMLGERFGKLARRERVLVAAGIVICVLMLGNAFVVEPQFGGAVAARKGIAQANTDIAALSGQLVGLREQLKIDPDMQKKAELAALRAQVEELSRRISGQQSALVPPERMNQLLETLLRRHSALRLVSLKSLEPVSILPPMNEGGDGKPVAREFDLYRHGVEITIEGTYADLYSYLLSLEGHEQRILLHDMRFRVGTYPKAQLVVVVHTLSAERAWLKL